MELLKFILSGFWRFVGFLIILGMVIGLPYSAWRTFWRHRTISKQGYPPPHCDADGDFKEEKQ